MNAPRILVTGSSGLVGSALVGAFRSLGYAVRLDCNPETIQSVAIHPPSCLSGYAQGTRTS